MIKINNEIVETKHFPDGTLLLKSLVGYESADLTWLYDSEEECMTVFFLVKHLRSYGVKSIKLIMPYIPNARMDRVKNPDEVFTLKYFADFINDLKFDSVEVLDPHSNVSAALINNIKIVEPLKNVEKVLETIKEGDNTILFFPDEGAMKRYSNIATKCNVPYVFGMKKRDWRSGDILGLDVVGQTDIIPGKNILIVDDICSKGGTFLHSSRALKALDAGNVDLYVSHLENLVWDGEMITSGLVRNIYTTNSIYRSRTDDIIRIVEEF